MNKSIQKLLSGEVRPTAVTDPMRKKSPISILDERVPPHALCTLSAVLDAVPVSRSTLFSEIKAGMGPAPIIYGTRNYWLAGEIRQFVRAKIKASRTAAPFDI